ncbi:MAG TPA: response regulator [Verrucomicrobiae bacterium]|jgi:CheY-like chemotaxis protein|nr:response regulator [Verrucomicrobiae bacterium]
MAKKKILVVDDEEAFGEIVKLNLEFTGEYEVFTEKRGKEAVGAARRFRPDLIILDVLMPDMDGPTVLKELKKDKELKDIPVVFLTALVPKKEAGAGVMKNQPFVAAKPIGGDELLDLVKKHIR